MKGEAPRSGRLQLLANALLRSLRILSHPLTIKPPPAAAAPPPPPTTTIVTTAAVITVVAAPYLGVFSCVPVCVCVFVSVSVAFTVLVCVN